MLDDDFGKRWWSKNKPMPDLIARSCDEQDVVAGRGR